MAVSTTGSMTRGNRQEANAMISTELLSILACPACDDRPPVKLAADQTYLACERCGRRYPIRDDIPVMLVEEAVLPEKPAPIPAPGAP
jgi:uncharacterized protein YbaR (Trm112 family)